MNLKTFVGKLAYLVFLKTFKYFPFISLLSYMFLYINNILFMYGFSNYLLIYNEDCCKLTTCFYKLNRFIVNPYNSLFIYMLSYKLKYCSYHRNFITLSLFFSILYEFICFNYFVTDILCIIIILLIPIIIYNFIKLKNSRL